MEQLQSISPPETFSTGKPVFPEEELLGGPIKSLLGPRSWLLFKMLGLSTAWMKYSADTWKQDPAYGEIESKLVSMKVVNDLAEICIKDVQEYSQCTTQSDYLEDLLVMAINKRGLYSNLNKSSL